ncbi:HAMP domain-containing histidine kinase [Paraburkholderia sp. Ac-20340]|uniref:sensor histidine kinase n=1 Tax=Paraburkholderia sp. Ac-20340 TaxID=2703888 RepID=UPI00197DA5AF|nr:HAMP domain-containing sensor histidine kinase [Paraburkholderia sp. Ac-20340]MBN3854788.1 HAMP domain-containing histidine kinase [Paraburkholderia sp. Ac-20340]
MNASVIYPPESFNAHASERRYWPFTIASRALWVLLALACLYASYATQALSWKWLVYKGLPLALPAMLATAIAVLKVVELHVHLQRMAASFEQSTSDATEAILPDRIEPTVIERLARAINVCAHHRSRRQAELLHVLAAYAHDLRTPLTRMSMRSELVEDTALRSALARDLAEMAELVEGSLSCARMQCSAEEPMRAIDADALLNTLIADYRDAGRIVRLEGQIGRTVVTCPHALRRVLMNLIDNALRYGDDVRLDVKVEAQRLVLSVLDSGPGIVPARLDKVFAAWYRGPETPGEAPGCGLGLAIARRLTLAMRGELELANRRVGGLEARLTLPLSSA